MIGNKDLLRCLLYAASVMFEYTSYFLHVPAAGTMWCAEHLMQAALKRERRARNITRSAIEQFRSPHS